MIRNLTVCLFCIIVLTSPVTAFSEEEKSIEKDEKPVKVKEVVVTATKTEIAIEEAPSAITVISREELEDKPIEDILDAVRESPGIFLSGQSVGGRKNISIRGMENRHSLILIDGKRIAASDAVMGHSDYELSWVPVEEIERIEIVRGPLSALYGSEAMGGVINIITKPVSKKWTASASLLGGLTDSGRGGGQQQYSLYTSGPIIKDKLGISLTGEFLRSEDVEDKDNQSISELEGKEIKSLGAKLSFTPVKAHSFILSLDVVDEERWRDTTSRGKPFEGFVDLDRYLVGLEWRGDIGPTQSVAKAYRSNIDKLSTNKFKDGSVTKAPDEVTDDVLDAHTSFTIWNNLFTIGGELREEQLESATLTTGKDDATHGAFFVQDEIEIFDRLLLTLGVRWDHHEFFGSETSPRVYALYRLTDKINLKAGYGHAFNAPTLKQVSEGYHAATGPHEFFGNPDVDPETSDNYEVGAEYLADKFHVKLFYFHNEIDDLIIWDQIGQAGPIRSFKAENVDQARTRGVETEVGVKLPYCLEIYGNYVYLDAEDTKTNERLEQRPYHTAHGRLKYTYLPLNLSASLRYEYIGSQILNEESVTGYSLWHFVVKKKLYKNFELRAGIENISDVRLADKSDAFDYEERGRFFYGRLTARF